MDVPGGLNSALAGRYTIERKLGEGGMATVYLAHDVRHDRRVALKVLRPELAWAVGAERFLSEIRTTANLQHPHILPLFDSGSAHGEGDDLLFYVMPYIDGESLRDRLDREGPLPVGEAVRIAGAVADALAYAQRQGVIHRDVKPENILLHEGRPLVADFGIALAADQAGGSRLTRTGLSLGTPLYMGPEQATGEGRVDHRTDVYALGCVLYEMLTGEPPHTGATAQAILASVLSGHHLPIRERRPAVPANVEAAVMRAIETLPADRFESGEAFARALGDPGFRHREAEATVGSEASGAARAPVRRWRPLAVGGWVAAGLVIAVWLIGSDPQVGAPAGAVRVTLFSFLPASGWLGGGGIGLAWLPDGSGIVYTGPSAGSRGTQLWHRPLGQLEPRPIPNSEGATNPAPSPDGASVAFTSGGALRTVSLAGRPAVTVVARDVHPRGIAWGDDGMLFYMSTGGILYRVPAGGGRPTAVAAPEEGAQHRAVAALPRGRGVLFTVWIPGSRESGRIATADADGGRFRILFPGTTARYAPSGHVVYTALDGTLMAAPFDVDRLEATGPSVALIQGVSTYSGNMAQFALSDAGHLAYATEGAEAASQFVRVSRSGFVEELDPGWRGQFEGFALSPDGTRLAVTIMSGRTGRSESIADIWIKELDRGPLSRLTSVGRANYAPTWTPEGNEVTFTSDRSGTPDLWTSRADGGGTAERLLEYGPHGFFDPEWSTDGEWLVGVRVAAGGSADVVGWRPAADSVPRPLVVSRFTESAPTLSPDGRWLAYVSDESGRSEVYVRPFPNVEDGRWQVSATGGTLPRWSHGGRELFYRSGADEMIAVGVEGSSTFRAGNTQLLFPAAEYSLIPGYAVAPDDRHFIMVRPDPYDPGAEEVVVVLNFFNELRSRVP